MTQISVEDQSDTELVTAVAAGDIEAYIELFGRHLGAARRLAEQIAESKDDVDDLLDALYTRVYDELRAGQQPGVAVRIYMLGAIRELAGNPTLPAEAADGQPTEDPARSVLGSMFLTLPVPSQVTLWHVDVDGEDPTTVAGTLGVSPEFATQLHAAAQTELRQAYATQQLAGTRAKRCRGSLSRLERYGTDALHGPEPMKAREHREKCDRCAAVYAEFGSLSGPLAGLLAPVVLGPYAPGYLRTATARRNGLFGAVGRTLSVPSGARRTALVVGVATAACVATVAWAAGNLGTPAGAMHASATGAPSGFIAPEEGYEQGSAGPTPFRERLSSVVAGNSPMVQDETKRASGPRPARGQSGSPGGNGPRGSSADSGTGSGDETSDQPETDGPGSQQPSSQPKPPDDPDPTSTGTPTDSPTDTPTDTPTDEPTDTPTDTATPTESPSETATESP